MSKHTTIEDPFYGEELRVFEEAKIIRAYNDDDNIIEMHLVDGILQSFGDLPAYKTISRKSGLETTLGWFKDGLEHRENGKPSGLGLYEDGDVAIRRWREQGVGHRIGGPSLEKFYKNKAPYYREHQQRGVYFCSNGPAVERISPYTGIVVLELWYTLPNIDVPNRQGDQPAIIERDEKTNNPILQIWMRKGQLFRENKLPPVVISDPKTGEIIEQRWDYEPLDKILHEFHFE